MALLRIKYGLRLLQKQVDLSLILKEGEYSKKKKTSRMDCLHKQELDRGDEKKDGKKEIKSPSGNLAEPLNLDFLRLRLQSHLAPMKEA